MPGSDIDNPEVLVTAEPAPEGAGPELRTVTSKLLRASATYAFANFGVKALNFLLLPLYTRFLTPADYGTISLAETVALIAALLCGLGLDAGIQRMYFQYVGDSRQLSRYMSSALRFAFSVNAAVVGFSLLTGPWLLRMAAPQFKIAFFPYIALAIGTVGCTQLLQLRLSLYQSEGRPRGYALLTFVFFAVTAGLSVYAVVVLRAGAYGLLTAKLAAALVIAAIAFGLLADRLFAGFEWRHVRETLRLALPVLPHQFMAGGLIAADRFILERYGNLAEVGLYSLAYTFGMVMALVTTSLSQAWLPLFYDTARHGDEGRQVLGRLSTDLAVVLVAIGCFGALISQDFVRFFLDPRYHAIGRLIPWIIAGYVLHGWFTLFQIGAFQAKRVEYVVLVSAVAFAANLGLNLALIPRWGMYGAAWATLLAYAVEAALMYACSRRIFPLRYGAGAMFASLAVLAVVIRLTQLEWPGAVRIWVMGAAILGSAVVLYGISGGRLFRALANRAPGVGGAS